MSGLSVDTTIVANANVVSNVYTLWIGATNPAITAYKPVTVTISVCDGSETIALATVQDQTFIKQPGDADTVVSYPDTWWTTSDASCTASIRGIYSTNVAPESATPLPVDLQDSIILSGNQLTLKTFDMGISVFYILGRSVGGPYAYQKATLNVCYQVLALTTAGTAVYEVPKNSNTNGNKPVEFLSAADFYALYSIQDSTCGDVVYEFLKSDGTPLIDTDPLFSLLDRGNKRDDSISIDTTVLPTDGSVGTIDYSFKVKATQITSTVIKDITVKIRVCGTETISLANSALIENSLVVRDNVTDTIALGAMFTTSDVDCPITSYSIKMSDADPATATVPTAAQTLNVYVEAGAVKLFAKDPGVITYWI